MELNQFRDVDVVLDKANDNIIQKQFVSAGDKDGRSLTAQITNAGAIGEVPGCTLNLRWHNQASGLTDLSAFSVVDRATSVFKIDYPQNMLTPGKVIAKIQILHDEKITYTKEFEIIVQGLRGEMRGVLAKAEFSALDRALAETSGFKGDIVSLDIQQKALGDKLYRAGSGTPKETFLNYEELNGKYPSGADSVMLVLESDGETGYIYSWNGSFWMKGIKYNERGLAPLSLQNEKIALSTIRPSKLPYVPSEGEVGLNLFNTADVLSGHVLDGFGNVIANPYPEIPFCVSDFIRVKPNTKYTRSHNDTAYFYDKNGLPIERADPAEHLITTPQNCYYTRHTIRLADINQFMLHKGTSSKHYEPYTVHVDGSTIKRKSVKLDKLATTVATASPAKNLFNAKAVTRDTYVNALTGEVEKLVGWWSSDFIAVESGETYYKNDAATQQFAFYASTNVESYVSGQKSGNLIVVPNNANFLIVTSLDANLTNFQIEKGNSFTGYEAFGDYIHERQLSPSLVNKINKTQDISDFKIQLPSKIYLVKDEEYQVHWRNVITNFNRLTNASVRLQEIVSDHYGALGYTYGDFWTYTPSTTTAKKIEIRITDDTTQEILAKKIIDLIISDKLSAEKVKTIITVGDSFTDGYGISKYLHDFVTSDSRKTLNMIGLNDTGKTGVKDDAWSGYGYDWYHDTSKGYLRSDRPLSDAFWDAGWGQGEANGWTVGQTYSDLTAEQQSHGFTKNEFYNPASQKFDFSYFMSTYMSNQSIDAFVSMLGLNDAVWKDPQKLRNQLDIYKNRIDNIIASVKSYDANIKILLSLVTPQQVNDSFMNSYGATFLTASRAKKSQEIWNQFILDNYDNRSNEHIYVMSTNAHFDPVSGLISGDIKPVKFDDTITKKVTADVHPTEIGAKYFADTVRNSVDGVIY